MWFGHRVPVLPVLTMCHWLKLNFVRQDWNRRNSVFQVWMENWMNHIWTALEVIDNQIVFFVSITPRLDQDPELQRYESANYKPFCLLCYLSTIKVFTNDTHYKRNLDLAKLPVISLHTLSCEHRRVNGILTE